MQVTVRNATNEPRHGYVTIPWHMVNDNGAIPPPPQTHVTVKYGNNRILRKVQFDRIRYVSDPDLDDQKLWELTVFVDFMSPGGFNAANPFTLDLEFLPGVVTSEPAPQQRQWRPYVDIHDDGRSVTLTGERLVAFLQLAAGPKDFDYQGGAFTSIRLAGREILDAFGALKHPSDGHDPEKRLQLDRVTLPNPPLAASPTTEVKLYNRDWKLVSHGDGEVRAWVVIESPEIRYPDEKSPEITGHLYRVISLYFDADYLVEEVFMLGSPVGKGSATPSLQPVSFAPHFFLKMNFGERPIMNITRVPEIPDWFTIASHAEPNHAFGFGSTTACGRIDNPPHDYPRKNKHSAFGWQLELTRRLRCMHLFKRGLPPHASADETGRKWFDLILTPAEVVWPPPPEEAESKG